MRRNKSIASTVSGGAGNGAASIQARALYDYTAAGSDETTIVAGDQLSVIEEDDGSGWTMVNGPQGQGLVPTSYIEITSRGPPPLSQQPQQKKRTKCSTTSWS